MSASPPTIGPTIAPTLTPSPPVVVVVVFPVTTTTASTYSKKRSEWYEGGEGEEAALPVTRISTGEEVKVPLVLKS